MTGDGSIPPLHVTLKIASRCNLNCDYCYVYNKADQSWREQPPFLSDEVLDAAIERMRRHTIWSEQYVLRIVFHGGEPLLAGPERLDRWCRKLTDELGSIVDLRFALQTNGTLIDEEWLDVFRRHNMIVGISLDGPMDVNDVFRVDHAGRGTFDSVIRGIRTMQSGGVPFSILSVIRLGADPVRVHRMLAGLGAAQIEYLVPDQTHDTIRDIRAAFGPTPCADYLIAVFDEWWQNGDLGMRVGPFVALTRAILGGPFEVDFIGNNPLGYLFVEPDGSIEGLDVLRICGPGLARTGLNVRRNDFVEIATASPFHASAIFAGFPLPSGCNGCPESETCAGGYLPHRYSRVTGFDNPSAWCADLLKLFTHLRTKLAVSHAETRARRDALRDLSAEARGVYA